MKEQSNPAAVRLSRRCLLRNAVAASGAAVLASSLIDRAQAAQVSQKLVAYQETPHGAQQCDNCAQFEAPSSCKVVEGAINPAGWCKVYVKKPA